MRGGKDEVAAFFGAVAEHSEVTELTPLAFASNDTEVVTVIRDSATGKCFVRGTKDTALVAELLRAD